MISASHRVRVPGLQMPMLPRWNVRKLEARQLSTFPLCQCANVPEQAGHQLQCFPRNNHEIR